MATKKRFSEQNEDKYSFGWDLPVKWEEGDISGEYSLPEVSIYPNNKFGDIARSQGLETARNWRKVREGTTAGINRFASPVTEGAVTAVSFSPAGGIVDAADIYNDLSRGNYAGAGATAALAFLPWGKIVRRGGSALRRQALRLPGYEALERKAVETAEKYGKKTWDKLQPYLYENPETKRKFDEAAENLRKTKNEYLASRDASDKANDVKYEYAKKEREALNDINKAKREEKKLREDKLSMTNEWGFTYEGNPYRYNIHAINTDDINDMNIKDLYEKHGITIFDPYDRKFINEMSRNGWDIRKVDFSKLSNKELRSIFKSENKSLFPLIRSKEGMDKLKNLDDESVEELTRDLTRSTRANSQRFNNFETQRTIVDLNYVDPRHISNEDFIKAYNARINADSRGGIAKLYIGDDGKIKFGQTVKNFTQPNIYSGLNTGTNEIWDILGGKVHKFDISVPNLGGELKIEGSVDAKDFSKFADSYNNKDLKSIMNISIDNGNNYFTPIVDKDYTRILKQNIEEIKRRIPGFKEFGSSVSASSMGLPHATDDIDGFMTREDFINVFGKDALKSMPSKRTTGDGRIITYKYNMDVGAPNKLPIDINIVDEPENLGELIRQVEPETYYNYMQNISRNKKYTTPFFSTNYLIGSNPEKKSAIDSKFLLRKMDPESKTIADMFEIDFDSANGAKSKHRMRPIVMMANGDPEKVAKGMDMWAKGNFGPEIRQAPDMTSQFTDVERNKKMLQQMGYEYSGAESDIAKDPKKMQNAFNYWYLSTTVRGRGVDPTGETPVYTMMTDWNPSSIGGNANGAGLNTVTMGNSGHGKIYGYIQPDLKSDRFSTPEEVITNTNRSMGMPSYKITKDEADAINKIISGNVKGGRFADIKEGDSAGRILDIIPPSGEESDKILDELDRQLGFRSLTRDTGYRNELYSSMTGEMKPGEVVAVNYPRTASLYARKVTPKDNYDTETIIGNMVYDLRRNFQDMALYVGEKPDYLPSRFYNDHSYSQFDNTKEGSFLDRALSRKSRFAEDAHRKANEEYEKASQKANEAYKKYRADDARLFDARKDYNDKEFKLNNERWKYNQGTKYIDYGIRSGFGLYGLSNLYDYMVDKAKRDREKDKEKSNGRRFGNEK